MEDFKKTESEPKKETPIKFNPRGMIKVGENQYKYPDLPNIIVNTSCLPKTEEENDRRLKEVYDAVFLAILKKELKKRGHSIEDLVL